VGDVDPDPAAVKLLGGGDRRATAAKRIERQIARVGRGLDDALEQGEGFLGGVTEAFGCLCANGRDVIP